MEEKRNDNLRGPDIKMAWQQQLRLLWCCQLVAIASLEMSAPFWPIYLRQLGDFNNSELQLVSALIYMLPLVGAMLTAPFWGRLGDKVGHKYMILRALLALFIIQCLIAYTDDLTVIIIARLIQGIFAGSIAATQAYSIGASPEHKRSYVIGKLHSAVAAGSLCGPLIGGWVIGQWSMTQVFIAGAIGCLLMLSLVAVLLPRLPPQTTPKKINKNNTASKVSANLWGVTPILILIVIISTQIAKRMPSTFFALYAEQFLSASPMLIGCLYAATGLSTLLTASYWGRLFDRLSEKKRLRWLSTICLAATVTLILQAYAMHVWQCLLLRLIWGVWLAALLPALLALLSLAAEPRSMGEIIGIGNSVTKLGGLCGIALGALAASVLGSNHAFFTIAIVYLAMAGVLALANDKLKPPPSYPHQENARALTRKNSL